MAPRNGSWGRLNGQIPGTCTEKFTPAPPSAPPARRLGGSDLTQLDTLSSKIATSCFQIQPRELAVQAALTAKSRQSLLLLRKGPQKKSGH